MLGELDRLVEPEGVAHPDLGGVDQADHVAGEGLLDGLAARGRRPGGRTWWRRACPVRPWVTTMPRSKRPEQTRRKAMRSRWDGSMLACTLNTKPENGASSGARRRRRRRRGGWATGTRSTTASSSLRTPKLVSAEPKNAGVDSAPRKSSTSRSAPTSSSRSSSSWAGVPGLALLGGRPLGVDELLGGLGGAAGDAGEAGEAAVAPVDDPPEVAGDAHRPGDGRGDEVDLLLDLVDAARGGRGRAGPTC